MAGNIDGDHCGGAGVRRGVICNLCCVERQDYEEFTQCDEIGCPEYANDRVMDTVREFLAAASSATRCGMLVKIQGAFNAMVIRG